MIRISAVVLSLMGLVFSFNILKAQSDDIIGSGRAIQFDGFDDYINLGNILDDLSLPVTISAWINVGSDFSYAFPIFNSQDNLPIYNGITFAVSPTAFSIQYGDGGGENNPAFRRGKSANIPDIAGRWVNLTAVMRGHSDMDLFLNGINVGGQYGGNSNLPMASMFPEDDAKIGFWFSNGITTHFKGLMDELRIFNRSLSEAEVREQMCKKLSGNESGLIGYWTFDEINGNVLKDKSINHFDGQVIGNPVRVFSGAPIGNESLYLYTSNWSNKSLKLENVEAVNIQGNPEGIHIYKVTEDPSQSTGLDPNQSHNPYYGIFLASLDIGNSFDLKKGDAQVCQAFKRNDNSDAVWSALNTFTSLLDRKEIILAQVEETDEIELGPNQIVCDQHEFILESNVDPTGKSIEWSTGQTTNSIVVSQSGIYALQVSSLCTIDKDTVAITFLKKPAAFSFGDDENVCILNAKRLKPYENSNSFEFEWQDGSTTDSFEVKDFGIYWVTVKNACGSATDTLKVSKINIEPYDLPNIITPNGDPLNQYFIVGPETSSTTKLLIYNRWGDVVFTSLDYRNDWDGAGLSTGVYYYSLQGNCIGEKKGSITIVR